MTDEDLGPLPDEVTVTAAFIQRVPSQRVVDMLKKLEPGQDYGEVWNDQSGRVVAFRALLRDHPNRDPMSLWSHAYDVELVMTEADPTAGSSSPGLLPSAPIST